MGNVIAAGASQFGAGASETPRRGIAMGIAVSLLLHLLLIFAYRLAVLKAPATPELPQKTMTVWLRAAPPPAPEPVPPRTEPPQKIVKVQPDRAPKPTIRKREDTSPAVAAQAPAPPQAITLAPPAGEPADPLHPELQPKKFDMNAALRTARKVANEPDPARAGLPVAQLDQHPLYPERTETQLARDMAGAKRSDCKNTPGGLLAPLIWLMDKKDSGCKW